MEHIEFEDKVMDMLLEGDDDVLEGLRNQLIHSVVESRDIGPYGFTTNYVVNQDIPPVANGKTFQFSEIDASYENIEHALGFIMFIQNGYLKMLEGFTYFQNKWPNDYSKISLKYDTPDGKRDLKRLWKDFSHWS